LEGKAVKITDTNFTALVRLCEAFGFSEIATKLSEFRPLIVFKEAEDADARGRIAAREDKSLVNIFRESHSSTGAYSR
jgi:hypothetical protein